MSAHSITSRGLAGRKIPQGTLTPMGTLLFSGSEPGAWYDPSDLSTLFQDSAGTTPVTAVEQPVGRMMDKSGRGNHATQATTTKRPVYSRRVNLLLSTTTLATQSVTTRAASYRLVFSGAGSVTLSGTASGVYGAGTHSVTCTAGSLTLTVSGTVQDASLTLATDAHLSYQRVNTDTDYDADPSKFPGFLRFDGVDDALQTANIDFTSTDKMTVWAGVTKLSDAASQAIAELGSSPSTLAGTFWINTNAQTAGDIWAALASSVSVRTGRSFLAPSPSIGVLSTAYEFAGATREDEIKPRWNGAVPVLTGGLLANAGSGPFGTHPLYIGARAGNNLFFNGRIYSLIVRGAQSTLSQIEATELYIKQKMRLP